MTDYAKIRHKDYLRQFKIVQNHVDNFCKEEYLIENYTIDFINDFYKYLIDEGVTNNTIVKYLSHIAKAIDYVRSLKLDTPIYVNLIALKYKPLSSEQTESIALELKELIQLEKYTPEKQYLQNIKDVFLFACYTGLRYSDLAKLQAHHIKKNDSCYYIDLRMIKTKVAINVPILDKAYQIIEKYSGLFDTCLPIISNQKSNYYIKILCKQAGINQKTERIRFSGQNRITEVKEKHEFVSMHTARRTFITILSQYAETESDRLNMQKFVGHSNFKTTNIYIMKSNRKMVESLNRTFGESNS